MINSEGATARSLSISVADDLKNMLDNGLNAREVVHPWMDHSTAWIVLHLYNL